MNDTEDLFARFFNSEIALVSVMDDLQLRAHRDELSKIAFEARARLTAVDASQKERNSKKSKSFQSSIESDDFTSDAINKINERQKKITNKEKEIEVLSKLGLSRAQAEYLGKDTINVLIKTEKDIEKMVAMNIDRKVAEGMYKSVTDSILKKLDGFEKPKDKPEIKTINAGDKCPECDFIHNETGNKTCPECKTVVNVIKTPPTVVSDKPIPTTELKKEVKSKLNPFEK